jgi:hypothetical protein
MPIKTQASATISQLIDYTPFSTGGEILVEDINQMFSYSVLEPTLPVDLQFTFGATKPLVATFQFKSLVKNATLQLVFYYDKMIFEASTNVVVIAPEQTVNVDLLLRINDMEVDVTQKLTEVKVLIENITNNSLVYGALIEPLVTKSLDNVITIYE